MSDDWYFDVLPYRPTPYEGECLSGYLLRLAAANGASSFRNFSRVLFPTWNAQRSVDILRWEYPVNEWDELSQRVQLPGDRLIRLTVLPWVAKFQEPLVETEGKPLRPGGILREIVRSTLQVCPLCLQEKPFLRLLWRLQVVFACLEHGCYLQGTCHACGCLLPAVSNSPQHLHCGHCGSDLRRLPVLAASDETLAVEERRQPDWEYLLDPAFTLVNESEALNDCGLPRLIGLKLRYLRYQAGLTPAKLAQQIELSASQIEIVEHGWEQRRVPLANYLPYLEGLGHSWQAFAGLKVPQEFFSKQLEPQYMSLRLCPTSDCPNHQPPPGTGVILRRHFPERGLLVLECNICKRKFTRTYEGEVVAKYRRPPLPPELKVIVKKPKEEVEQVRQLGLQGRSTCYIARHTGWGKEALRNCWHSLGLTAEVRAAQKRRRQRKLQAYRQSLLEKVDSVLDSLCQRDERITFVSVSREMGWNDTYMFRYPELANRVREVAAQHNGHLEQHRYEELQKKIEQVIAGCRENGTPMSMRHIVEQAGTTTGLVHYRYPELWLWIRAVVELDRESHKMRKRIQQCQQINEAATRLTDQGTRLTKSVIIQEAQQHVTISVNDPEVNELLDRWVGDMGST